MALGDINSRKVGNAGDAFVLTGSIEASSTPTVFALLPSTKTLISCTITNMDNTDAGRCRLNNSANGSVEVTTGSATVASSPPSELSSLRLSSSTPSYRASSVPTSFSSTPPTSN